MLRELVEAGRSVREIAEAVDRSPTAVRHWLRRFGLRTRPARYHRRDEAKPAEVLRERPVHGWTGYRPFGRQEHYRCPACLKDSVAERRRRVKEILVHDAGGGCALCGYSKYLGALQFHHVDPAEKSFGMALGGIPRSLARARAEAAKCVLLCANCHAEVEAGVSRLPFPQPPPLVGSALPG